jgi:hypothetical protein
VTPGEGPFDTFGTEGDGDGDGDGDCQGSALQLDDPQCEAPTGPTDECIPEPGAAVQVSAPTITETLPETQEAEIAAAVAPDGTEYVATQILDWESRGMGADPERCLVQKGIGVYRRVVSDDEDDDDVAFERVMLAENEENNLDIEVGATSGLRWYTDPYFAVSEETGAVYLSVLKWPGLQTRGCSSNLHRDPTQDFDEEVQLWVIPPGGTKLEKVAVAQDGFTSAISEGLNGDADPKDRALDHPRVAVHPLDNSTDRVVVTFNIFQPQGPDYLVTLECAFPGTCALSGTRERLLEGALSFSNPRFDTAGDLYIAHARAGAPEVLRFVRDEGANQWGAHVDSGTPNPINTYFTIFDSQAVTAPGRHIVVDTTPAMAIAQLGNATTPVVWLAWVTRDDDGDDMTADDYGIEIAAANADDLSVGSWTPTVEVPKEFDAMTMRANHWAPELAVDGENNILDLVNYRANASVGTDNVQLDSAIWPRLSRFRAHDLTFVGQASVTANPGMDAPLVVDLPSRGPDLVELDGTPIGPNLSLFLGEYIGLAQRPTSGRGLVAWNLQRDEDGGLRRSDVAANRFDAQCPDGLILDNGTHITGEAVTTCADPSTAPIGLTTFGTSIASLCQAFPLCGQAENLLVEVTAAMTDATGGQEILLTSLLEVRQGKVLQAEDSAAVLGQGPHVVDLCATDVEASPTALLGCIEQPVRVEGPLGSGVDGFGHFAGVVAGDFVPLADNPGATVLDVGADGIQAVALPSSLGFTYYGDPVTEVVVGANGGLRFSIGSIGPSNTSLPTSLSNAPDIAVYWDDLDPSTAGTVSTFFDGRRFIVSWESVPHAAASAGGDVSVQAHLYPGGRIELHYDDTEVGDGALDFGASATIGMQSGGDFVQVSHNDATLLAAGLRGLAFDTTECIASPLVIPPFVSCTTPEVGVTVCSAHGQVVQVPLPDVEECAPDAELVGQVTHSGPSAEDQRERPEPLDVIDGAVVLDAGVHTIEWTPTNADGFAVGPAFPQVVHVREWVTEEVCCDPGQTRFVLGPSGDVHFGSGADECVLAGGGGDVVYTFGGNDLLAGQGDADVLFGGADADVLVCDEGDDVAYGQGGPDLASGGAGQDVLTGDGGLDDLDGGPDADVLHGNADADTLRGRAGSDVLAGGAGPDRLYPGSGADAVFGDGDDDEIYLLDACELTSGKALFGGTGHDVLFVPPGITLADLAAAGVFVASDIEDVVALPGSHSFASDCAT